MLVVWPTPEEMIRSMRTRVFVTLFFAAILIVSAAPGRAPKRKIACKTAENATSCYRTHGRLAAYNGTPTMRLWKIGTKRIMAIHSGPGFKVGDDHENLDPEMPENLERALKPFQNVVFADFEICPLEPEVAGTMQRVCIESAKKYSPKTELQILAVFVSTYEQN